MRIHQELETAAAIPDLHLAVGIFDGVHLGHQAVIESAVRLARIRGGRSGVLTFTPHPSRLFRPDEPTLLLQPADHKEHMLRSMRVDELVWMPFTRDFAGLAAEAFVGYLKERLPGLRSLHVGENFRFGKGRGGDVGVMVSTARPLRVHVVSIQRLRLDGEAVSSTRLREALRQGKIADVNDMLGYNYFTIGQVKPGRQLGRTLGFPTLNLAWAPECQPRHGVYAVRVRAEGGSFRPAVANYGLRPTVEQTPLPLLEVHLLDAAPAPGPGDTVTVEWLEFIRPELKFANVEALVQQIAIDSEAAGSYFRKR